MLLAQSRQMTYHTSPPFPASRYSNKGLLLYTRIHISPKWAFTGISVPEPLTRATISMLCANLRAWPYSYGSLRPCLFLCLLPEGPGWCPEVTRRDQTPSKPCKSRSYSLLHGIIGTLWFVFMAFNFCRLGVTSAYPTYNPTALI